MYVGPIYCAANVDEVCPWCIADGRAAMKWDASFNDIHGVHNTNVSREIVDIIYRRTPGFSTWQTNMWMFAETDAMVFLGEVNGKNLLNEGNTEKVEACLAALAKWQSLRAVEALMTIMPGGEPAIYLFQDRQTGSFSAYADMG